MNQVLPLVWSQSEWSFQLSLPLAPHINLLIQVQREAAKILQLKAFNQPTAERAWNVSKGELMYTRCWKIEMHSYSLTLTVREWIVWHHLDISQAGCKHVVPDKFRWQQPTWQISNHRRCSQEKDPDQRIIPFWVKFSKTLSFLKYAWTILRMKTP